MKNNLSCITKNYLRYDIPPLPPLFAHIIKSWLISFLTNIYNFMQLNLFWMAIMIVYKKKAEWLMEQLIKFC